MRFSTCYSVAWLAAGIVAAAITLMSSIAWGQQAKKHNILIIWGDDIGWFNPSCYHGGVMGYQTPNVDRIAREGIRFTDWYGQQSCTAGRAACFHGHAPLPTPPAPRRLS